jgi:ABC-type branched-subunit amino acid transport system ATPase component
MSLSEHIQRNRQALSAIRRPGNAGRGVRRSVASGALLEVHDVTVRFGGVIANNEVSFSCAEGSITALLGPNGAGKTTMFNVISGAQRPSSGSVHFAGHDVTHAPSHARARLGMGRTFQNLSVVEELTVLENVRVGTSRYTGYGVGSAILGLPNVRRRDAVTTRIARAAIDAVGLSELSNTTAGALPYGDLRRLELARALCLNPRLLLLDEPAAGLDNAETRDLVDAIRGIREHWGVTVLLVEHDLELVRSLAEYAFVMDFGAILAGGPVHEVLNNPAVVAAYVGAPKTVAGRI